MLNQVLAEDNVGGRFADNDLATGTRGTRIEAREQNAVFFELRNAIVEAGINLDATDETQLAQAIVAIARREGGINALQVEMSQSPQSFNIETLGIPDGNYTASVTLIGANPNDITLSYELISNRLTLYSWYTNDEGKRVQGVPLYTSGGGFGKSFGLPFAGTASGAVIRVSILLTAF